MGLLGSETPDGLSEDDLTDLDAELLGLGETDTLLDRHTRRELLAGVAVHLLPASLVLAASVSTIDTDVLAPSIGLDLLFLTGLLVFVSGILVHVTRTFGTTRLLTASSVAILLGSSGVALTLVNAATAPSTFLTTHGFHHGFYAQTSAAVVTLSVIGTLLVVTRLLFEHVALD